MRGVFAWLHAISSAGPNRPDRSGEPAAPVTERPSSTLFQCQECETVYIASEKRRCSNCDVAVERVQSTPTAISNSD